MFHQLVTRWDSAVRSDTAAPQSEVMPRSRHNVRRRGWVDLTR